MTLEGTKPIPEIDLLPKEDLFKRWIGASSEAIAAHVEKDELHAYKLDEGPIMGVVWCKPGHVTSRNLQNFLNRDQFEFNDGDCDFFLLQDVKDCEAVHPEYLGTVTIESLGLEQICCPHEEGRKSLHAGLEIISAEDIIRNFKLLPRQMVKILNGIAVSDDKGNFLEYKRLETVEEEQFQAHMDSLRDGYYFNEKSLSTVRIYQECLDRFLKKWGKPTTSPTLKNSEVESQLCEANNQIASFEQLRNHLEKQNQKLTEELAKKDLRIAELEAQTIPSIESTTTVNATKWKESVEAAFNVWVDIFAGDKEDWIEDEFRGELSSRYKDYHTEVHAAAWRLLPSRFKKGPGRPKKNPQKSQHTDNK